MIWTPATIARTSPARSAECGPRMTEASHLYWCFSSCSRAISAACTRRRGVEKEEKSVLGLLVGARHLDQCRGQRLCRLSGGDVFLIEDDRCRDRARDDLAEELLLRTEVVVDQHRGHAGTLGDLAPLDTVVAPVGESPQRRNEDGIARRGCVAGTRLLRAGASGLLAFNHTGV